MNLIGRDDDRLMYLGTSLLVSHRRRSVYPCPCCRLAKVGPPMSSCSSKIITPNRHFLHTTNRCCRLALSCPPPRIPFFAFASASYIHFSCHSLSCAFKRACFIVVHYLANRRSIVRLESDHQMTQQSTKRNETSITAALNATGSIILYT